MRIRNTEFFSFFFRYVVKVTADRKRNKPAHTISWSNKPPVRQGRRAPENQLDVGESISNEAKAAETTGDLWSLFITEEMLDLIVLYTNQKIDEDIQTNDYTEEQIRKHSHIRHVDKVRSESIHQYRTIRIWLKIS
jgi:hypothetical protein